MYHAYFLIHQNMSDSPSFKKKMLRYACVVVHVCIIYRYIMTPEILALSISCRWILLHVLHWRTTVYEISEVYNMPQANILTKLKANRFFYSSTSMVISNYQIKDIKKNWDIKVLMQKENNPIDIEDLYTFLWHSTCSR